MTLEEAAAVLFGEVSALYFLKEGKIQAGQKVLIYGASGSVGIFAVQLAKHFGAHVTGVCSTANLELVKSLGADEVVDYTREDFSRAGRVYDMVFDTVGKSGFSRSLKSLKRGGYYVRVGGSGRLSSILGGMIGGKWASITGAAKVISGVARGVRGDQSFLKELIEAGELRTVIDRRYSRRNPVLVTHSVAEMVAQRVYALALGYEDLNDHEQRQYQASSYVAKLVFLSRAGSPAHRHP